MSLFKANFPWNQFCSSCCMTTAGCGDALRWRGEGPGVATQARQCQVSRSSKIRREALTPLHALARAEKSTKECRIPDYAGLGASNTRRERHPNRHTEPLATGVGRKASNRLTSPSVRSSAKLLFPESTARGVHSAPNLVTPHALTAKLVVEAFLLGLAAG